MIIRADLVFIKELHHNFIFLNVQLSIVNNLINNFPSSNCFKRLAEIKNWRSESFPLFFIIAKYYFMWMVMFDHINSILFKCIVYLWCNHLILRVNLFYILLFESFRFLMEEELEHIASMRKNFLFASFFNKLT